MFRRKPPAVETIPKSVHESLQADFDQLKGLTMELLFFVQALPPVNTKHKGGAALRDEREKLLARARVMGLIGEEESDATSSS